LNVFLLKYKAVIGILLCFLAFKLKAQDDKKKDFINIKTPVITPTKPTQQEVEQDSAVAEPGYKNTLKATPTSQIKKAGEQDALKTEKITPQFEFEPRKNLSYIQEDTNSLEDDGEISIVEISEQMNMGQDSFWVKIAEYYQIWDSRKVNPYNIDPAEFKDSVQIVLYDERKGMGWSMPLKQSRITSHFGLRGYRYHYGTDLGLAIGDSILAVFDGVVRITGYHRTGYGYFVVVRHYNGLETVYGHMSKIVARQGQYVKAGDLLGYGGSTGRSTGPHLHFEIRFQGNAIDPQDLFDFEKNELKADEFLLTPDAFNYVKKVRKVVYHRIRSGDNLGKVAKKYGTTVSALCKMNRITPKTILRVGKVIRVR
jgi:murein DD-endopeptidase MepM/ murein hydrolase activator NlpD